MVHFLWNKFLVLMCFQPSSQTKSAALDVEERLDEVLDMGSWRNVVLKNKGLSQKARIYEVRSTEKVGKAKPKKQSKPASVCSRWAKISGTYCGLIMRVSDGRA